MPLRIVFDDILTLKADALVNSTNTELIGYSGVDKLVHEAGGPELEEECKPLVYTANLGESLHTKSYNLGYKYIIHTICPGWEGGYYGEEAILRSCYWTALSEADKLGCQSVATILISAGSMSFPIPRALQIAVTAIRDYCNLYTDLDVSLVLYGAVVERIAKSVIPELDDYLSGKVKPATGENPDGLEDALKKHGKDFVDTLTTLMWDRGLTDAQLYKKAFISKGTYNKIINGGTKKPSIQTVTALAMALELTLEETENLLASAGMAFSDSSKFDIIVRYFIEHGRYDIWELDEQLVKYGFKSILGSD